MATEAFVSGNYATKAEAEQSGSGIEEQKLSTNGYFKFADGIIVQFGAHTVNSSSPWRTTITFPIPFPNLCASVSLTQYRNYWDSSSNIGYHSLTRSSVGVMAQGGEVEGQIRWIAIGY